MRTIVTLATLAGAGLLLGCKGPIDPAAHDQLLKDLGDTSITVFPTLVRTALRTYDEPSAARVGAYLTAERLAAVTYSKQKVDFPGEWAVDQSRMFRESVEAFRKHVEENPLTTEYGLVAEFLLGTAPGDHEAVGIHAYVLTKEGKLALGVGLNSHQKLFADAKPRTVDDCTRVLIDALKQELQKRETQTPKGK